MVDNLLLLGYASNQKARVGIGNWTMQFPEMKEDAKMAQTKDNKIGTNNAGLADSKKTAAVNGEDLNQVLDSLKERMGKGSIMYSMEVEVEVDVNMDWLKEVAINLLDNAYAYDNRVDDELTPELLSHYLKWVVLNRINYVRNGRNVVHPKDIKYPVVMFDALARIADYNGSKTDGAFINPKIKDSTINDYELGLIGAMTPEEVKAYKEELTKEGVNAKLPTSWVENGRVIDFPNRVKITRMLEIAGIQLATGLPMEKRTTDRTMYEMSVDTQDSITTAGSTPSIAQVFGRCFYEYEAVTQLVGPQKVELLLYNTLKEALVEITGRYVEQKRK